jgi:putative exporter of polyketide antibiotics
VLALTSREPSLEERSSCTTTTTRAVRAASALARQTARDARTRTISFALLFLWETIGGLVEAPAWALDLSPFHHVGLVPAEAFQAGGAAAMLGIGALAGLVGAWRFARRDLSGP